MLLIPAPVMVAGLCGGLLIPALVAVAGLCGGLLLGLCLINVDQSNSYQGCGELPPHKETALQPHLLHTATILLFSALWSAVKPVLSLVN